MDFIVSMERNFLSDFNVRERGSFGKWVRHQLEAGRQGATAVVPVVEADGLLLMRRFRCVQNE